MHAVLTIMTVSAGLFSGRAPAAMLPLSFAAEGSARPEVRVAAKSPYGPAAADLASFKEISPVKGRCRWQGTQVLAFEPEAALGLADTREVAVSRK